MSVKIALTLEAAQAAALHRLCEKISHSDAKQYLYPHIAQEIREEQAYDMVGGCVVLYKELCEANVRHWPWIETGDPST